MRNEDVFEAVAEALRRGEPAALVTIIRAQGSTPQRVGAKMLVFPDGRTVGTIGGGCYENEAFWKARTAIETRQPIIAKYELADDIAEDSGLICGGQMEVYIEPIEPAPALYLVGAGHVSYHLAQAAHTVGFKIHVIDDREKFANTERFPDAEEVVVDAIPEWLTQAELPAHAFAVILTRGHRHDLDALRALAPKDIRYLGLIGSRAKVARIYEALKADGIAPERLRKVHAPVGLDLGAVTPQEIAVSILAEMIAVKYGKVDATETSSDVGTAASLRWTPGSTIEATVDR
jgi:xanthine dehydrogenase accessory factor